MWRELVDRGGKGLLIGGANEFQEFVAGYYGIQSDMISDLATKVICVFDYCQAVLIMQV